MPTNERSLWVRLGLSSKNYNRGFDRAEKRQDKFKKQTTQLGNTIKGAIAGVGVAAIGSYVSSVVRAQTETQRWADRIGINVEAFQELQFAAKEYGITQEALTDGLKELSLRTDEYIKTGVGPAAEAFKRLQITQEELNEVSGDTEKLFELVRSRISGIQNAAAKQRIADELFGGQGGEQFIELLDASNSKIQELRKEARETGAVVEEDISKNLEELSTAWDKLGTQLSSVTATIFGNLIKLDKAVNTWKESVSSSIREWFGLEKQIKETNKESEKFDSSILAGLPGPGVGGGSTGGGSGGGGTGGGGGGPAPTLAGAGKFSYQGATFSPKTPQILAATRNQAAKLGTTLQGQVTPQMDAMIRKTNETGNVMSGRFAEGIELGGLFTNVFAGMQNVIQSSLDSSKGFLDSFGKFFADFIKGLIMKLVAATAAAFVLAIALQAITGGVAGGFGAAFGQAGNLLGGTAGGITGALGLADGGQLKKGGNYLVGERGPEMVTMPSGSTVRPLSNVPDGAGGGRLVASVSGEDLNFILEKYNRKKGNSY